MAAQSMERRTFLRWGLVPVALSITVGIGCLAGCAFVSDQLAQTTFVSSAEPQRQPREQIIGRWRCTRSTIAGRNRQAGVQLAFLNNGTFQYRRPGEASMQEGTYRLSRDGLSIQLWYRSRDACQSLDVELQGDALVMRGAAYDGDSGWSQFENEYSRIE